MVSPLKDALVTAKRNYKKALKSAKYDYRRLKAECLRDSCLHGNSKKFWNIVNSECKAKSNAVDVNSIVTSLKDNFANSLDNNFAVKNFYYSLG